ESQASDPYNDHENPPSAIFLASFLNSKHRIAAVSNAASVIGTPPDGMRVVSAFMRRAAYPVAGQRSPSSYQAAVSSVVRYRRPIEGEDKFVKTYLETHPRTEGKLPGIRNVFCYLPEKVSDPAGLADADYVIGNEVAFDSVEAFNAAMGSPVREELRDHFRSFPKIGGRLTHDVMERTRLFESVS
ncbi:MAG: hypothetical protein AAGH38_01275, partial [Pseudomonadota bacterium]